MSTPLIILWILFYLLAPAGVIWLCRRSRPLARIGTILLMYILGILAGNLLIYPFEGAAEALFPIQDALSSVTIPLAMPLILFACNFKGWPVRQALVSLLCGIVAVTGVAVAGYFLFGSRIGPEAPAVAGMAVGVYTGGTPNLAAVKMMLGVDEATYLLINSFDLIVSFLYLTFLMVAGIRLARRFLPVRTASAPSEATRTDGAMTHGETEMYRGVFSREHRAGTLRALGLAILIAGAGIGLSLLLTGSINMIVLILTLTTLSIAASFLPAVRSWEKSYDAGMYLVLIFSLVVASMVDIRSIDLHSGIWLLSYVAFVIFGSLLVQLLLCRLFRVDADTAVITSVAMINSPLFVPMIAESMKNRRIIITGITAGIIGYAVGNYLGVLVAGLLG
ncbi:MAG: DUF819 family protein [Bacteroidales bacterium]|nr:DUF819 family protein [Bacteroidales bacterium]